MKDADEEQTITLAKVSEEIWNNPKVVRPADWVPFFDKKSGVPHAFQVPWVLHCAPPYGKVAAHGGGNA